MRELSPKDTKCTFCGRYFTRRGLLEHQRHHCPKNKDRRPRVFKKRRCKHCGKEMHGNGLRVHVASVHPEAYRRSRSVRAHRMKERPRSSNRDRSPKRTGSARAPHKGSTRSRESAAVAAPEREAGKQPRPSETHAQTTKRIWEEVRRMQNLERRGT